MHSTEPTSFHEISPFLRRSSRSQETFDALIGEPVALMRSLSCAICILELYLVGINDDYRAYF